jgi:hypothetical protein
MDEPSENQSVLAHSGEQNEAVSMTGLFRAVSVAGSQGEIKKRKGLQLEAVILFRVVVIEALLKALQPEAVIETFFQDLVHGRLLYGWFEFLTFNFLPAHKATGR